jgi:hypothetical protein
MVEIVAQLLTLLIGVVDHAETQAKLLEAKATWDAYAAAKAAADLEAQAKFGPRP